MGGSRSSHRSQVVPAQGNHPPGTGSRETPENRGVVPGGGSRSSHRSRVVPGQGNHPPVQDVVTGSRSSIDREPGTTLDTGSPGQLAQWLDTVKIRGLTLTIVPSHGARLDGPLHQITTNDANQLARHRHALETAGAGTHPDWWNTVLGRAPAHPDLDLPGSYHDPACACCGQPAPHLGPDLLAWCDTHA